MPGAAVGTIDRLKTSRTYGLGKQQLRENQDTDCPMVTNTDEKSRPEGEGMWAGRVPGQAHTRAVTTWSLNYKATRELQRGSILNRGSGRR